MGWRLAKVLAAAFCCLGPVGLAGDARAADAAGQIIRVAPGQSLRAIAEQHLGDPDLWPSILELNGLTTITDVKDGMSLRLPVAELARANRAIDQALAAIQAATQAGARLFAPEAIAEAIALHDQAITQRTATDYEGAAASAEGATAAAGSALAASQAERDVAAEALLSDRQGWVEGQRPKDLIWSDRPRDAVLIEEEKVRTLSRSTAQITFRDDSRLRLNANSHAVIQRMRADLLSKREDAKVSLIEGDFYAVLGGKSARKRFEVEVANVETDIRSTNFWVSKDAAGAKFTNYDSRVMTVAAAGEQVTLGRNEGTLVRPGRPPEDKASLLPGPELLGPSDAGQVLTRAITFRWQTVAQAAGYWLEVAFDPDYRRMTASRWGLPGADYTMTDLAPGTYYWRVAALDQYGLPGSRSLTRQVSLQPDLTPPFLSIERPTEGAILRDASLLIEGQSEAEVRLTVNGQAAPSEPDGAFKIAFAATPGVNQVAIEAIDAAGNVTRRARSFSLMPDATAALTFAASIARRGPTHFVTASDQITLTGRTEPAAGLAIQDADGQIRAAGRAAGDGAFSLNLPVETATEEFRLAVTVPSGFVTATPFTISIDRTPPALWLSEPPPPVTAAASISLRGQLDEAATLTLNGQPLAVQDRSFTAVVPLASERNRIELAATDPVGNVQVASWDVRVDRNPPVLVQHRLAHDPAAGDLAWLVEIEASDPSGMPQAAAFTLLVDGRAESGFLNLDPATGRYLAKVVLEQPGSRSVRLQDVLLEDYAGNRRRYVIE